MRPSCATHVVSPTYGRDSSRTHSRRAVFLTYNPSSEGDFHEAYYEEKARVMREVFVCSFLSAVGFFACVTMTSHDVLLSHNPIRPSGLHHLYRGGGRSDLVVCPLFCLKGGSWKNFDQ